MTNVPNRTPVKGGGLSLPENMGMSPAEERAATHRWDTLERVVDSLNAWGFDEASQPKVECPVITPELLLTPDIKQYTAMFTSFLHWFNYSNKIKARVIAELLQLENEMEDIAAETRKRLRRENEARPKTDKLSSKDIEDEITTNLRFRELKIRAQEIEQMKFEMNARCEELERSLRVISRNIEVRKEEMGDGRKAENMPHRVNREDRFGR